MNNNSVNVVEFEKCLKDSYIEYSKAVVMDRAVPDIRDGLKPVHRRILWAMRELGLTSSSGYKKCARIVGDVIGKYHPHGDQSVYDALVRMGQDFNMGARLVDGQGNFGSVDGDNAAAMRYTEAKLSCIGELLMEDLKEQDIVEFKENYDNSLKEPSVLPDRICNILVNGSYGIAVGMSTAIPTHNLVEVMNGLVYRLEHRECRLEDIMEYIKGPDYPSGGIVYGKQDIVDIYRTGKGSLKIRGRIRIEDSSIVVEELPYQVEKPRVIEQIKKCEIDGVVDVKDLSDRNGCCLVVYVKKNVNIDVIVSNLYRNTDLEKSYSVNMLGIRNGRVKVFGLLEILDGFLEYREEVVVNRSKSELDRNRDRLEILEGYKVVLEDIENVVGLIKNSKNTEEAIVELTGKYGLTEKQSKAVLELKLVRLTNMEIDKIVREIHGLKKRIKELIDILDNQKSRYGVIKKELMDIVHRFPIERKSMLVDEIEEVTDTDVIVDEQVVVTLSYRGYIKRVRLDEYKVQSRGGSGKIVKVHSDDFVKEVFNCSTRDIVLCISDKGRCYGLAVSKIPECSRTAIGKAIVNMIDMRDGEKISSVVSVKEFTGELVFITKHGLVKRTRLEEYRNVRSSGIQGITLREGDEVFKVLVADGDIVLCTSSGQILRVELNKIRVVSRLGIGVIGIKMKDGDKIVAVDTVSSESDKLLSVSANGIGKLTSIAEYKSSNRGGIGVKGYRITSKTGNVVSVVKVQPDVHDIIVATILGNLVRLEASDIRECSRNSSGVRLISLKDNDRVISVISCCKD